MDSFKKISVALSQKQLLQFEKYHSEILAWNPRANLISKNDESRIVERHFLESAALIGLRLFDDCVRVLDLGAGAGFPGVPIKIIKPQIKLTLLDSRNIKAAFLENMVQELSLENTAVVCDRAENLKNRPEFKSAFDVVLSRAVADLSKVFRWAQPLLRPAGVFVSVKGSKLESELKIFRQKFPLATLEVRSFPSIVEPSSQNQRIVCVSVTDERRRKNISDSPQRTEDN